MKRALTILAATAACAFTASAPARAAEEVSADRILTSIYTSLGMADEAADVETSRNGFFVGVHAGMGSDSGIAPATAGMAIPLDIDGLPDSLAANGYYVYNTGWSLGTYVGGGFGKFNLSNDPLLDRAVQSGTLAYQGMAGVTYAFTPSMVLGLEYRYSEPFQNNLTSSTLPQQQGDQDQSVTLRFDFLLN